MVHLYVFAAQLIDLQSVQVDVNGFSISIIGNLIIGSFLFELKGERYEEFGDIH